MRGLWIVLLGGTGAAAVGCPNSLIAHSNRDASNPCSGNVGTVCDYTCASGYLPVGRHVCMNDGHYLNNTFFGGRCVRLCEGEGAMTCPSGLVPLRRNVSDCLSTVCLSPKAALENVGRGNYAAWRMAYNNKTGITTGSVSPETGATTGWQGRLSMTAVAAQFDAVAVALGWTDRASAQARFLLSLRSLTGQTAGFTPQTLRGFWKSFFDTNTGIGGAKQVDPMDSGLGTAALLFAAAYYDDVDPSSAATKEIVDLTRKLFWGADWAGFLCNKNPSVVNATTGTGVPFLFSGADGKTCGGVNYPRNDGMYTYNEEMTSVWLAYESCAPVNGTCTRPASPPAGKALEKMWAAWQGRRLHPTDSYAGYPLLSQWSGYIVHLVYYTTPTFIQDKDWTGFMKTHWQADKAYYANSPEGGLRGRYGLGAGPCPQWCANGAGYIADRLNHGGKNWCYTYSPYVVAGYLPVSPDSITQDLLDLLADGESVQVVTGTADQSAVKKWDTTKKEWINAPPTPYHVLSRKAVMDPGWYPDHLTMVDFASELWGLSTLWLPGGAEFYSKYTDSAHIIHGGSRPMSK